MDKSSSLFPECRLVSKCEVCCDPVTMCAVSRESANHKSGACPCSAIPYIVSYKYLSLISPAPLLALCIPEERLFPYIITYKHPFTHLSSTRACSIHSRRKVIPLHCKLQPPFHSSLQHLYLHSLFQKKKGNRKGKIEVKSKDSFQKLNDDEKNDLVGQEVELVQTEIDQVQSSKDYSLFVCALT
eukprot:1145764-Pelagomonas_calceolata.AAC.1